MLMNRDGDQMEQRFIVGMKMQKQKGMKIDSRIFEYYLVLS